MVVLDTDCLSLLERIGSIEQQRLTQRLSSCTEPIVTTIVNYEEKCRGWLSFLAKANTVVHWVDAYAKLERQLGAFRSIDVLGFDAKAATRYQELRKAHPRHGTMDLRVAAIALANDATLVTRNTRDFHDIENLTVEDWTL